MTEQKHSPLPWEITPEPFAIDELWFVFINDADGKPIARIKGHSREEAQANAALIVRAVNNLPEVIHLLDIVKEHFEVNGNVYHKIITLKQALSGEGA